MSKNIQNYIVVDKVHKFGNKEANYVKRKNPWSL